MKLTDEYLVNNLENFRLTLKDRENRRQKTQEDLNILNSEIEYLNKLIPEIEQMANPKEGEQNG